MKTHASLLCLTALMGLSLSGCAAIYRFTRPVNESLQAPLIEMPDGPGAQNQQQPAQPGQQKANKPPEPIIRSQSPGGAPTGGGDC